MFFSSSVFLSSISPKRASRGENCFLYAHRNFENFSSRMEKVEALLLFHIPLKVSLVDYWWRILLATDCGQSFSEILIFNRNAFLTDFCKAIRLNTLTKICTMISLFFILSSIFIINILQFRS